MITGCKADDVSDFFIGSLIIIRLVSNSMSKKIIIEDSVNFFPLQYLSK